MQDQAINNSIYNLESYHYNLPPALIAQFPVEPRDSSRLLVLNKESGRLEDRVFRQLIDYLEAGDTLVINHTRVIPARLFAYKDTGAKVEILLLSKQEDKWEALVRPARKMKAGSMVNFFGQGDVQAEVIAELDMNGGRLLKFHNCPDVDQFISKAGQMPLPPYINRIAEESDKNRYQTVYAQEPGSAAAPTAGLHFTDSLLQEIKEKGVNIARILLHVGLGTFRPVSSLDIREHRMHYEYYQVDEETAQLLNATRKNGRHIVAVGTTVVRTLETVYNDDCGFSRQSGETNKFIYPGYTFKAIDKMITNFHLPGSSLLMLVAALAGLDPTMSAYQHAVDNEYRFFSYGDAMLIT
ncbi:MAG: tRNA preQ1(34) S-adenosylmethionine ribosyltransferase-isomerase QueA [Firmicutes bacterium HGW-Firmicutes-15]|nr:MAG: tRNA preQ1(34) S-adenosylmethionine ribosyltransferase-isomerase QueA [Firmicutes bacterium HGW-Firmicutes-15]